MHPDLLALCRRHGFAGSTVDEAVVFLEARLAPAPASETFADVLFTAPVPAAPPLSTRPPAAPQPDERYRPDGILGRGGMGEVHRVEDRQLERSVARKVLRAERRHEPGAVARFLAEARTTAGLQHPGIPPVYELGVLPDGTPWFTMKEVQGRTLAALIADAHTAGPPDPASLRRLVEVYRSTCDAVAYAHSRGVVHRDLKPANVMVGDFGEVLVLDWGLARTLTPSGVEERSDDPLRTRQGAVAGTPAYMSPEQARGELASLGPESDVFSLGAMLYHLLAGRPPYRGDAMVVLASVREGPPGPLPPGLPDDLVETCARAMARAPADRFGSAAQLAAAVGDWLDGARTRERALAVVSRAAATVPEAAALRQEARRLRAEAERVLADVAAWRPEVDKAEGWALEEQADELERRGALLELQGEQLLAGALTHAPALPEAHAALAARYRAAHAAAEAARRDASREEALLRASAEALPDGHPERAAHLAWLSGEARLTLVTEPPGARVRLFRYRTRRRRRVAEPVADLGPTPVVEHLLPHGHYLCLLERDGHAAVAYPVALGRGAHWNGALSDDGGPHVLRLPAAGALAPDDRLIPAGPFLSGGDPQAEGAGPERWLWCDDFVMQRFPVTNRRYIAFLDALVSAGESDRALALAPRERSGTADELGALVYGFDGRHFHLRPDSDGDSWHLDWPVIMVSWHGAVAFAEWAAARDGLPWRLPSEWEWEKAARGVDGRWLPWGDHLDPSWCCMRDSHVDRPLPAVVDSFPVDESPYGVRGLAGNSQDWCAETFEADPRLPTVGRVRPVQADPSARGPRATRGGCWYGWAHFSRAASRFGCMPGVHYDYLGFRLVRSL